MSKRLKSIEEFKASPGDSLSAHEAPQVRALEQECDISIAYLLDLWSRMPAPHEFHPNPAAVHETLDVSTAEREAEIAQLEGNLAISGTEDPAGGQIERELLELYRQQVYEAHEKGNVDA